MIVATSHTDWNDYSLITSAEGADRCVESRRPEAADDAAERAGMVNAKRNVN